MKVSLIGSGNVATVLGRKLKNAGHDILQVISPNQGHASALAQTLNCAYTTDKKDISQHADIYLIAISDHALPGLASQLNLGQKTVVHTAGSVSIDILKTISKNYGVIYPLQSLRKEIINYPEIIVLTDANTEDNLTLVYDFAKTFADRVEKADDTTRLKLHVAAVFVNNFSNHLYSLAKKYCDEEKISFEWLLPLINETAERLKYASPQQLQTGPAIRNDLDTIQKHLALLNQHPALKKIYETFSDNIRELYGK